MATLLETLERLPILNRSLGLRQFVVFSLVGVTNTIWDFGIYLLLTSGVLGFRLTPLVANPVGFTLAVLNSYALNRTLTFRHAPKRHVTQLPKFILVNVVTLLVYEGWLGIGIHRFGLYHVTAKATGIVFITFWNFVANKYWTFRHATVDMLADSDQHNA